MDIYNKNILHNNNGIINNVGVQNIQETHLYTYFVCHRDKSHKQLVEYNEIFEMMEHDDSISSNV